MVFVTGATGLLGKYLVKELATRGKKIRAIYRTKIPQESFYQNVEWVQGDILDPVILQEAMQGVDEVYHCAAMVTFNPRKKQQLHKINVEGTANVVNAAIVNGVKKLVHVSSVAALGRKIEGVPVTENVKWSEENNNSQYGKSKHFAEMEVWRGIAEGLHAVIVNPVMILGVGDWNEGSSALFKNAWKEFPWYTEGVTGFVDAADVAKTMIGLMESEVSGERFIVSAENWPYKKMFTAMATTFGKKPPSKKVKPYMASLLWRIEKVRGWFTGADPLLTKETADTGQRKTYFDNTKLITALPGFAFKPLQQTIEEYCLEYKSRQ